MDLYWLPAEEGQTTSKVVEDRRHLDGCRACSARFRELAADLDGWRGAAALEADAVFGEHRLTAQRDRILRRLEALGRPPRVVAFPSAPSRSHMASGSRVVKRWVAAAAAAGLITGVVLGRFVQLGDGPRPGATPTPEGVMARQTPPVSAVPDPNLAPRSVAIDANDEAFLTAVDEAIASYAPRIAELRAIDAWTPQVRDASLQPR